jgi:tRNA pseudouridine55 synthase
MNGIIIVDKPEGWTSHDVVGKFRGIAKTRRVGHLGTLDPIATGVLPLIVGNATRLAQFYTKADKIYEATIRFGHGTDSYDRTGAATTEPAAPPELDAIERALAGFQGRMEQTPPQFSAKKVAGVPAYKSARKNIEVALKPVEIEIYELSITSYAAPDLCLRIRCSGGTYVRTIAHDLGLMVGCGAHLQELRRVASGDFRIAQARTLAELQELAKEGRLSETLLPSAELLPAFPGVFVDEITAGHIRQGRDFPVSPFRGIGDARYVKALNGEGDLLAIGEFKLPHLYHPLVVLG